MARETNSLFLIKIKDGPEPEIIMGANLVLIYSFHLLLFHAPTLVYHNMNLATGLKTIAALMGNLSMIEELIAFHHGSGILCTWTQC